MRNFYSYWQCSPAMGGRLSYRWPDGWTPVGGVKDTGVYMLLESDKKRRAFMIIMRHAEGKRLAVVVRGTETVPEWMIGVGASDSSPAHAPSPATDATSAIHLAQLQVTSGASRRLRSPRTQAAASLALPVNVADHQLLNRTFFRRSPATPRLRLQPHHGRALWQQLGQLRWLHSQRLHRDDAAAVAARAVGAQHVRHQQ